MANYSPDNRPAMDALLPCLLLMLSPCTRARISRSSERVATHTHCPALPATQHQLQLGVAVGDSRCHPLLPCALARLPAACEQGVPANQLAGPSTPGGLERGQRSGRSQRSDGVFRVQRADW